MSILKGLSLESEKYHIIRELGRGGMGVVYLAEDQHLKREVALKVLYDHLNREHTFVERFQEEARSVSTLHHPNIVCVHGLERSNGVVAIDMEYVDGPSLDLARSETVLSPHLVVGIARDVLGGLATCHQIGIVHRDIKPSNILLAPGGQAKLTDFGLATAYASHLEQTVRGGTSSGFYMGTPRYMPVAAWEGARPDPAWDLYSLGVVLFELLSGKVAFDGDNPMAIMKKHLLEPLPRLDSLNSHISPQLADFVASLLSTTEGSGSAFTATDGVEALRETPEYQELSDSNSAATLALPPLRKLRRVRSRVGARWRSGRKAVAVGLAGVLALGLVWALIPRGGDVLGDPPPVASTAPEPISSPGGFPDDGTPVFLDVFAVDQDGFGTGTWMVERDSRGEPQRMTGVTSLGVWVMDVGGEGSRGARRRVTGSWATALSEVTRTVHFGRLTGMLAWDSAAGSFVLSMEPIRDRDNEPMKFSVYGRSKGAGYDTRSFYRALEASPVLQPLLYGELLGRSLPWALALEARLPSLPGGRVTVPHIEEVILVDGVLDEPTWVRGAFDATGRVGEVRIPGVSSDAPLLIRWNDDGVYLAARVADVGARPQFELGVLPALEISSRFAGRFFVTVGEQGIVRTSYLVGETEQLWQCNWENMLRVEEGVAFLELRIPLSELEEAALPRDQKRWRINARLSAENEQGERVVRSRWGDEDPVALAHGVLSIFSGGALR